MKIVRELMVPLEDYSQVTAGASLHDVIRTLAQSMMGVAADPSRPRDRGVLVQGKDGRILGKLSLWDILNGLKPNFDPPIDPFGQVEDHLLWSQWLRPDIAEKARSIRVEDLLKEALQDETIEETAPLDLAVHRLIRGRHLSLLVLRTGEIVGVLRLSDVFKAVNDMIGAAQRQPSLA
jgi:CBS domain-containing protein